jgi:hypothetical protein
LRKIVTAQIAEITSSELEKICANLSAKLLGKILEKIPENKKPKRGRNTVSFKSILIARKLKFFASAKKRGKLEIAKEKSN